MESKKDITKKDIAYAAVKAALGSIPVLGAAATEIFGLVVTPPLDKRRKEWMNDVAEKLKQLESSGRINISELSQNEQFIDTIIQATNFAIKTSEEEKIAAFKNAVLNTALEEAPEKSKSQIFLNLVDRYTTIHIKILRLFTSPKRWFRDAGKSSPNLAMGSLKHIIFEAYPELKRESELLDVIWADLGSAGFHRTSDLGTTMSGSGLMEDRATGLGKEFLEFISSR